MNERIRLLAEQAFDNANDANITNIKIPKEFVEKFSELLVKEAASIASDFQRANIQDRDVEYTILEHFEVE